MTDKKSKKNKKSYRLYKKLFIKRIICFIAIQTIFLFLLLWIQHDYSGINSDNTTKMECKIDDIYYIDTPGRNDQYYVVIGEETYRLFWHREHPGRMKDVRDDILSEPAVIVTFKPHIQNFWISNGLKIVDIRTKDTVYFDMYYVDKWEDMQRENGMIFWFMLWISYTLMAVYVLIFYRGEKI